MVVSRAQMPVPVEEGICQRKTTDTLIVTSIREEG